MLVTDSQFNIAKEKSEEKKVSLWSKILFSLTHDEEQSSDVKANQMDTSEIYPIC